MNANRIPDDDRTVLEELLVSLSVERGADLDIGLAVGPPAGATGTIGSTRPLDADETSADSETLTDVLASLHLQWFAAEDEGRTEEPTEHKIQKAREDGKVARSQDVTGSVILLFTVV
ncbi:MAG: EscU/YscU/HrcU family type III secretion system export apparatus switch protein, partial [Spirochaetota bacterium]